MIFLINNDNTNPAINLATEEYAVRNLDLSEDYCFLYVNDFCSVSGKNQNIFEEIDYKYFVKTNVPFYRRISGGGTVIHDPGNINFSFITKFSKNKFNKYGMFTRPVISLLNDLGVRAYLTDRNDIFVGEKKISGNAQFTSRDKMMSHGTLLFNSDLKKLSRALNNSSGNYESKSSKSFRSPVTNIYSFLNENLTAVTFKEMIKEAIAASSEFTAEYHFSHKEQNEILNLADQKYRSFEWNIGRSPKFVFENAGLFDGVSVKIKLEVDQGIIQFCKIDSKSSVITEYANLLEGIRYEWSEVYKKVGSVPELDKYREILVDVLF